MPTAEELRNKQQLYYDDVEEGQELDTYEIGPMTTTHAFRWSAAIENWHRIHYDQEFAVYHDGLPNVLIHGSWKQSVMPQYLKDLCLPDAMHDSDIAVASSDATKDTAHGDTPPAMRPRKNISDRPEKFLTY